MKPRVSGREESLSTLDELRVSSASRDQLVELMNRYEQPLSGYLFVRIAARHAPPSSRLQAHSSSSSMRSEETLFWHPAPRPRSLSRHIPARFAAAALVACLLWAAGAHRALAGPKGVGPKGISPQDLGFLFTKNLQTGAGELVEIDTRTSTVLGHMDEPGMRVAPQLLVSPHGNPLFTLGGEVSKDGKTVTQRLAVVDTSSGATETTFPMPQRIQYVGPGPGTMVLSPDLSFLYVYSYRVAGPGTASYWLTPVRLAPVSVSPKHVGLPNCGPAYFVTAMRWVVALCNGANDVRFVDPRTSKVVARVPLPSSVRHGIAALETPRSGDRLYAVTVDLRIVVVDTKRRRVLRTVSAYRQASGTVPGLYSAAISADDRELIVGATSRPHDPTSTFSLHAFYLPSLKRIKTVRLPQFTHIASAPGGGLYTFPMGDSSDTDWRVRFLGPELAQTDGSIPVGGPVFQLAVPIDAFTP